VPQKAVSIETDGSKAVWIIDTSNIARKRAVVTSTTYKNNWVIKSGLEVGDAVVVEGAMMLKEGVKVVPKSIKSNDPKITSSGATNADEPTSDAVENNKTSSN
jgi:membrane fusion protein (multidrug efflux system)